MLGGGGGWGSWMEGWSVGDGTTSYEEGWFECILSHARFAGDGREYSFSFSLLRKRWWMRDVLELGVWKS